MSPEMLALQDSIQKSQWSSGQSPGTTRDNVIGIAGTPDSILQLQETVSGQTNVPEE